MGNKLTSLKKAILTLILVAVFLCAGPVWADITKQISDTASIAVYGQINRALMVVDNGEDTETLHVDNENSSSRIGAKIKAEKDGLTAGANFEFEYKYPGSDKIQINGDDTDNKDSLYRRKVEVYLSGVIGTLTLGYGPTVSDTSSEIDLSGTCLAGRSKVASNGGGIIFFDEDVDAISTTAVGKSFSNMDGTQKDRARYDSPEFYGFKLSTSVVADEGDDAIDGGISYKGAVSDTKIQGAVVYVDLDPETTGKAKSQVNGSVSALFPIGLSLTFASGKQSLEDSSADDPTFFYGKLGYMTDIWSVGKTAMSIDYGKYQDQARDGDDGDAMGIQFVQILKDWYTELYIGYRLFSLDRDGTDYKNINTILAGMRLKF